MLGSGPFARQPYADEHGRTISSLSAEDVADLSEGRGWGLAKPAEFNGYPGPAHVLELADRRVERRCSERADGCKFRLHAKPRQGARLQLIDAEKALDAAFVDKSITGKRLQTFCRCSPGRRDLRQAHLAAHLEVTPVLNDGQKARYAALRGYGSGHEGH